MISRLDALTELLQPLEETLYNKLKQQIEKWMEIVT